MKWIVSSAIIIFLTIVCLSLHAQQDNFTQNKDSYLGQKPPGLKPQVFAPGIVSTEAGELNISRWKVFLFHQRQEGKWRYLLDGCENH